MFEIYARWEPTQTPGFSAIVHPSNPCPPLLLTVWQGPDGRWRACTEFWEQFGSWAAPQPLDTLEQAEAWAVRTAEGIAGTYPPPGGDLR